MTRSNLRVLPPGPQLCVPYLDVVVRVFSLRSAQIPLPAVAARDFRARPVVLQEGHVTVQVARPLLLAESLEAQPENAVIALVVSAARDVVAENPEQYRHLLQSRTAPTKHRNPSRAAAETSAESHVTSDHDRNGSLTFDTSIANSIIKERITSTLRQWGLRCVDVHLGKMAQVGAERLATEKSAPTPDVVSISSAVNDSATRKLQHRNEQQVLTETNKNSLDARVEQGISHGHEQHAEMPSASISGKPVALEGGNSSQSLNSSNRTGVSALTSQNSATRDASAEAQSRLRASSAQRISMTAAYEGAHGLDDVPDTQGGMYRRYRYGTGDSSAHYYGAQCPSEGMSSRWRHGAPADKMFSLTPIHPYQNATRFSSNRLPVDCFVPASGSYAYPRDNFAVVDTSHSRTYPTSMLNESMKSVDRSSLGFCARAGASNHADRDDFWALVEDWNSGSAPRMDSTHAIRDSHGCSASGVKYDGMTAMDCISPFSRTSRGVSDRVGDVVVRSSSRPSFSSLPSKHLSAGQSKSDQLQRKEVYTQPTGGAERQCDRAKLQGDPQLLPSSSLLSSRVIGSGKAVRNIFDSPQSSCCHEWDAASLEGHCKSVDDQFSVKSFTKGDAMAAPLQEKLSENARKVNTTMEGADSAGFDNSDRENGVACLNENNVPHCEALPEALSQMQNVSINRECDSDASAYGQQDLGGDMVRNSRHATDDADAFCRPSFSVDSDKQTHRTGDLSENMSSDGDLSFRQAHSGSAVHDDETGLDLDTEHAESNHVIEHLDCAEDLSESSDRSCNVVQDSQRSTSAEPADKYLNDVACSDSKQSDSARIVEPSSDTCGDNDSFSAAVQDKDPLDASSSEFLPASAANVSSASEENASLKSHDAKSRSENENRSVISVVPGMSFDEPPSVRSVNSSVQTADRNTEHSCQLVDPQAPSNSVDDVPKTTTKDVTAETADNAQHVTIARDVVGKSDDIAGQSLEELREVAGNDVSAMGTVNPNLRNGSDHLDDAVDISALSSYEKKPMSLSLRPRTLELEGNSHGFMKEPPGTAWKRDGFNPSIKRNVVGNASIVEDHDTSQQESDADDKQASLSAPDTPDAPNTAVTEESSEPPKSFAGAKILSALVSEAVEAQVPLRRRSDLAASDDDDERFVTAHKTEEKSDVSKRFGRKERRERSESEQRERKSSTGRSDEDKVHGEERSSTSLKLSSKSSSKSSSKTRTRLVDEDTIALDPNDDVLVDAANRSERRKVRRRRKDESSSRSRDRADKEHSRTSSSRSSSSSSSGRRHRSESRGSRSRREASPECSLCRECRMDEEASLSSKSSKSGLVKSSSRRRRSKKGRDRDANEFSSLSKFKVSVWSSEKTPQHSIYRHVTALTESDSSDDDERCIWDSSDSEGEARRRQEAKRKRAQRSVRRPEQYPSREDRNVQFANYCMEFS